MKRICPSIAKFWPDFISAEISKEDFCPQGRHLYFIIKKEHKILSGLGIFHRISLLKNCNVFDLIFNSTNS